MLLHLQVANATLCALLFASLQEKFLTLGRRGSDPTRVTNRGEAGSAGASHSSTLSPNRVMRGVGGPESLAEGAGLLQGAVAVDGSTAIHVACRDQLAPTTGDGQSLMLVGDVTCASEAD